MPICLLALHPSRSKAIEGSGGTDFVANDCRIQVNSNNSQAVNLSGGSTMTSGENCFVGGVQQGLINILPAPTPGCASVADPFLSYSEPTVGSCDHMNLTYSGGTRVLSPGVYCGGITFTGGVNATFLPGLYILKDGDFVTSGGGSLFGEGVSFYLTGAGAGLNFSGGGQVHLKARSSGDLAGILFYLDRNAAALTKSVVSGGGEMYYEGILYFPTQKVEFSGGGTSATPSPYTMFIGSYFIYTGGSQLLINADADATDLPIPAGLAQGAVSAQLIR